MSYKKRWLIIYVSAGEGHRRAGESIYRYIKESFKDIDINFIDALDFSNFLFRVSYKNGYNFLVKKTPLLWKLAYILTEFKLLNPFRFCLNRLATGGLKRYILKYEPDIIIATHFLPVEVVSYLKRKKIISSFLAVVITDFVPHPFWLSKEVDIFLVACSTTKERLISGGIEEDKIFITGIPVDLNFSLSLDKKSIAKKLDLKEDLFTALIVTAGFGLGPIEKLVELLHRDIQLLVVCGYNQRLFKKLSKKNYPQVRLFGFVDNMEELMTVSDIIITKPGGLTISEAIIKELPMIFISPIFGQETENIKVMKNLGIGLVFNRIEDIKDFILRCKADSLGLSLMKRRLSLIKKPYAVKEIVDVVYRSSSGVACRGTF